MKKIKTVVILFLSAGCIFSCACGRGKEDIRIEQPGVDVLQKEEDIPPGEIKTDSADSKAEQKKESAGAEKIWVDVCGAVNQPGVYELDRDSRVFEAIEAAGGLTENADTQWMNQASVLCDGEKIRVYTQEEVTEMKERGIQGESADSGEKVKTLPQTGRKETGKVNLNTASLTQLQEIPGIGEVRAQAILDYREKEGSFRSIDEIQEVPGIKGKTFEKIESYITVE